MDPVSQLRPYFLLLSIFLLQCCRYDVQAVTTISHPRTASVCSGDQLELTCTSTRNLLQWRITIPNGTASRMYGRALAATSQEWQIRDNLTTFTFSVISGNSLMLMSRLLVSPINEGLNRTEVNCVDDDDTSSSTIDIISKNAPLGTEEANISVALEKFESDGVTTILEWAQESTLYSYYVSVTPDAALWINGSANVNLKLKIPYDTSYNISVVATPPCRQDIVTHFVELFYSYGYCGNPADQVQDDNVLITGHIIPVVIGTNVNFICVNVPELVLMGPTSATCIGNGEWEPNPREVHCIGRATEVMNDLDGQQQITLNQNGKIAMSSAAVFVVTLVIGLVIGFLCGHFCQKQRKTFLSTAPEEGQASLQGDPSLNLTVYENALELQENASYASVH